MDTDNGAIAIAGGGRAYREPDIDEQMWQVLAEGDIGGLEPAQRTRYVQELCRSLGLNPLTQPIRFYKPANSQKLQPYATKNCAEQLRSLFRVSFTTLEKEIVSGIYTVTVYAQDKRGRVDLDLGAVAIHNLQGEALANAIMKAITKAKRRVTLSICGLGSLMDETEVESVGGQFVDVDPTTGRERAAPPAPRASPPPPGLARAPRAVAEPRTGMQVAELRAGGGQDAMAQPAPSRTEEQNRRLHALAAELFGGDGHAVLHDLAELYFGVASTTELSERDAAAIIRRLSQEDPDPDGIRASIARERERRAAGGGQPDMTHGQSAERGPAEAALIAFRERAEASDDWEADAIYSEAGESVPHWLALVAAAPAVPVLSRVEAHLKRRELLSAEAAAAIADRRRALRARADAFTR